MGPDSRTYIQNSASFEDIHKLLAPEAFQANYWVAGYSGFLRIFSISGEVDLVAVRVSQALLVISMAYMSYRITATFSQKVGNISFLLILFSPNFWFYSQSIAYEIVLAWLIFSVLYICSLQQQTAWINAFFAGLLFSIALIVQFKAIVLLPVVLWLIWRKNKRWKYSFFVGFVLPLSLWMIRNTLAIGDPRPWTRNGGINLWIGNNPNATGRYTEQIPEFSNWGHTYYSAVFNFWMKSPIEASELLYKKFFMFFEPVYQQLPYLENDYRFELPIPINVLVVILVWSFAILVSSGFVLYFTALLWRVDSRLFVLLPFATTIALFHLSNTFFIVEARMRLPVEALMITVAIPTFFILFSRLKKLEQST